MSSTALAVNANTQAALASVAAQEAALTACMGYMRGYKHDSATVVEMRKYAECVAIAHPSPLSHAAVIEVKIAIIVVIVAMVVGALRGWLKDKDVSGAIVGGFEGLVTVFCLWLFIWLSLMALNFLLS